MAGVLTEASEVKCGHAPGAVSPKGNPKLTVGGSPVLTQSGIVGKSVSGCPIPDDQSKGTQHCSKVTAVTRADASKLKVDGNPVSLDTLGGTTDGLPAPQSLVSATANQSKLRAV